MQSVSETDSAIKYTRGEANGRPVHRFQWPSQPVNARAYSRIASYVRSIRNYGPMTRGRAAIFRAFIVRVNARYGSSISIDQAISIRNLALKDKIIKNYARVNGSMDEIARAYRGGAGVLDLSQKYDFPPLGLLRGVFLKMGYDAGRLRALFADKMRPDDVLGRRDAQQFRLAERNDAESTFNQQEVARVALENENRFVDYFRNLRVGLRTQDDLVAEQTREYGKPILTPDVLFTEDVYINGRPVKWIDYKDYVGTDVKFILSSNLAQAAKYHAKWGPGAICYRYGFVDGLHLPGAILLDGGYVPM